MHRRKATKSRRFTPPRSCHHETESLMSEFESTCGPRNGSCRCAGNASSDTLGMDRGSLLPLNCLCQCAEIFCFEDHGGFPCIGTSANQRKPRCDVRVQSAAHRPPTLSGRRGLCMSILPNDPRTLTSLPSSRACVCLQLTSASWLADSRILAAQRTRPLRGVHGSGRHGKDARRGSVALAQMEVPIGERLVVMGRAGPRGRRGGDVESEHVSGRLKGGARRWPSAPKSIVETMGDAYFRASVALFCFAGAVAFMIILSLEMLAIAEVEVERERELERVRIEGRHLESERRECA